MPLMIVTGDCADALLQIRGHPFTILRTPFDDSTDTLWWFRRHPLMIPLTPFDDSVDILDDAVETLRITDADKSRIS